MAKKRKHKKRGRSKDPPPAVHCSSQERRSSNQEKRSRTAASGPSTPPGAAAKNNNSNLPLPFPRHLPRPPTGLLRNDDAKYQESFQAALETAYEGFAVDSNVLETEEQQAAISNTLQVELAPHFRKDVTQPFGLGTPCAKTFVTRCLVGDLGTTYKYLGLRMFAHPWPESVDQLLRQPLTQRTAHHLRELRQKRESRNAMHTSKGRNVYDICLINCMTSDKKLKEEPVSQLKTTVSWHADSSLEHFSSIAVYQWLVPSNDSKDGGEDGDSSINSNNERNDSKKKPVSPSDNTNTNNDWSVALRVAPNSEGPDCNSQRRGAMEDNVVQQTPYLGISLPSNSCYYLLDDFNHHHQHTVLTSNDNNSATRYSCTFRLLRESHNVQHIVERCRRAVSSFHKKGRKVYRSEQLLLTEMETEWLRQFYIQGAQHRELLFAAGSAGWRGSIQQLLHYWSQLERRTHQTEQWLRAAAHGVCVASAATKTNATPLSKADRKARDRQRKAVASLEELNERESASSLSQQSLFDMLAELLEERAEMREQWAKRARDPVFRSLEAQYKPLPVPFRFECCLDNDNNETGSRKLKADTGKEEGTSPLPEDLRPLAGDLRALGRAYASRKASDLPLERNNAAAFAASKKPHQSSAASQTATKNGGGDDNAHSKPMDWPGWEDHNLQFGLEMQTPWAESVMTGEKTIETRAYNLPQSLRGQWIAILQSPQGQAGVSTMGNQLDFSDAGAPRILGWCKISSVIQYKKRRDFEKDEAKHLVKPSSGYGWKDGTTETIFGWVVSEYNACDESTNERYRSAVRRMRSLFELYPHSSEAGKSSEGKASATSQNESLLSNGNGKNKRKKRRKKANGKLAAGGSASVLTCCLLLSVLAVCSQAFVQPARNKLLLNHRGIFQQLTTLTSTYSAPVDVDPVASGEALDALVPRSEITKYYSRSNLQGILQTIFHATVFVLAATIPHSISTLAMAFVSSFYFCSLHECVHMTAFRSRTANRVVAHLAGFLTLRPARHYLFYHTQHHKYTGNPELDSELQAGSFLDFSVTNLPAYLFYLSGIPFWIDATTSLVKHSLERCPEIYLANKKARNQVIREARIYLLLYAAILIASVWHASFRSIVVRFWVIPAFVGQPFLRFYLLAEHQGRKTSNMITENTRTMATTFLYRRLAWNMPYHIEHHAWPSVPFHKLGAVHRLIVDGNGEDLLDQGERNKRIRGREGYLAFHRQFLAKMLFNKQQKSYER